MAAFFSLLSPRLWIALGLAVVVAFGALQTVRLNHAKAGLAAAQPARERETRQAVADRRTYTENLAVVHRGLDRCNAATAAAGAAARVTASRLQEAAQAAQDARETAERRASALLAGRAGANACQSALDVARSLP